MDRLPAVPISGEVVVTAAAEVFGVPARRLRSFGGRDPAEQHARDACAWVMSQIGDAPEQEQAAMLGRVSIQHYREAVRRADMRRDVSLDYAMQTDAMLAGVYAVGRVGMGRALKGVDALDEARRMVADPIRAVKAAPAAVMAAMVERLVDLGDIVDLCRQWLAFRDLVFLNGDPDDAKTERALAAAVRDALGLPEERGAGEQEHAA